MTEICITRKNDLLNALARASDEDRAAFFEQLKQEAEARKDDFDKARALRKEMAEKNRASGMKAEDIIKLFAEKFMVSENGWIKTETPRFVEYRLSDDVAAPLFAVTNVRIREFTESAATCPGAVILLATYMTLRADFTINDAVNMWQQMLITDAVGRCYLESFPTAERNYQRHVEAGDFRGSLLASGTKADKFLNAAGYVFFKEGNRADSTAFNNIDEIIAFFRSRSALVAKFDSMMKALGGIYTDAVEGTSKIMEKMKGVYADYMTVQNQLNRKFETLNKQFEIMAEDERMARNLRVSAKKEKKQDPELCSGS